MIAKALSLVHFYSLSLQGLVCSESHLLTIRKSFEDMCTWNSHVYCEEPIFHCGWPFTNTCSPTQTIHSATETRKSSQRKASLFVQTVLSAVRPAAVTEQDSVVWQGWLKGAHWRLCMWHDKLISGALLLDVVQLFFQNNGPPADAEITVRMPPDHLLCVPGQRHHYQPAAALHFTLVAG